MKRIRHGLKRYFIPHEENNHRPRILEFRMVAIVCAVLVVAEVLFWVGPAYLISRSKLFGVLVINALVDGTNQNRLENNLPALHINPLLQAAAQEKANDMAAKGYFAHTSPTGVSPWYWFMNVGYQFTAAGENLAVNFSDSQDVTNAWMNSPGHRANILNGNFTEIGMATATGTYEGRSTTFVVELFGTPSAPITSVVAVKPVAPAVKPATAPTATTPSATAPIAANVKGAETQVVPSAPQVINNPIQNAVAAPHSLANDLYLFIIGLFVAALGLNVFIKIRIQYPDLIFGGVLVIALAAIFIVLNQQGALAGLRIG